MSAIRSGIVAFREELLSAETNNGDLDFNSFEARNMRYQLLMSYYENNTYRRMHSWSKQMKETYGLYRSIRNIYNPTARLGDFWRSHLLAGKLDPLAGDGVNTPSAFPIITKNENLRPAIAQLWKDSNWNKNKDILSLIGTIKGDVFIRIIDNPEKGKVYLLLTEPETITDITTDDYGNIKGYVLEELRPDPSNKNKSVVYKEIARREGEDVVYEVFLNNAPYKIKVDEKNPNVKVNSWSVPYGFIPMVAIQHNDIGKQFGMSEIINDLPKFREVDDLTSKLNDQIRKAVEGTWLLVGVPKPTKSNTIKVGNHPADEADIQYQEEIEKERQKSNVIYGPLNSNAVPLIFPLDVSATSEHIGTILKEIEADYPELSLDYSKVMSDPSGKALRILRAPIEDKVLQRRVNYDDAICRIQQMAVAIGGWRGYKGYEGFDLNSYAAGNLDHSIGSRPVFRRDESDKLEDQKDLYVMVKAAKDAGIPIDVALRDAGWDEKKIKSVTESDEYKSKLNALDNLGKMGATNSDQNAANSRLNTNGNDTNSGAGPEKANQNTDNGAK